MLGRLSDPNKTSSRQDETPAEKKIEANAKPNTNLFSKYSTDMSSTPLGLLSINGINGQSARIWLEADDQLWSGQVTVYTLTQLQELPQAGLLGEEEKLIHTWQTKRDGNTITIYSGEGQLAFTLTAENRVEELLAKLKAINLSEPGFELKCLDYFKEASFAELVKQGGLTIAEFNLLPGLTTAHLDLFLKQQVSLNHLLRYGFTLGLLCSIELERVKLFMNMDTFGDFPLLIQHGITLQQIRNLSLDRLQTWRRHGSLFSGFHIKRFITLAQALGLSHTPPVLPRGIIDSNTSSQHLSNYSRTRVAYRETSSETVMEMVDGVIEEKTRETATNNEIVITATDHSCNADLNGLHHSVEFATVNAIFTNFSNSPKETLIHDWYMISRPDQLIHVCPQLKYLIIEKADESYPEQAKELLYKACAKKVIYYLEKSFAAFLAERGCPLEEYKQLSGNTLSKLSLLAQQLSNVEDLLTHGIQLPELAQVDEKRLTFVLKDYEKAKQAFHFIDARELLGLNNLQLPPSHSLLFNQGRAIAQRYLPTAAMRVLNHCVIS